MCKPNPVSKTRRKFPQATRVHPVRDWSFSNVCSVHYVPSTWVFMKAWQFSSRGESMLGARIPEVFGPDPALGRRNRGRPACGPSRLSGRLLPLSSGSGGGACAVSLSLSGASSRREARSLASLLGDKPRPAEALWEKPAKACGRLSTGEQRGRKR